MKCILPQQTNDRNVIGYELFNLQRGRSFVHVGEMSGDADENNMHIDKAKIIWPGGTTRLPVDS